MDADEPVVLPIGGSLDLHSFRPSEVGDLVPDRLAERRRAGLLQVRGGRGKGSGTLRAGVRARLERSPLVRALGDDGNWGGVHAPLGDPAGDKGRVRVILEASPRLRAALEVLAREGPPGAWRGRSQRSRLPGPRFIASPARTARWRGGAPGGRRRPRRA